MIIIVHVRKVCSLPAPNWSFLRRQAGNRFCPTSSRSWIDTTALAQVALCTTCRWKPVIWTLPSYTRQCQKACALIASAKMMVLLPSTHFVPPTFLLVTLLYIILTVSSKTAKQCSAMILSGLWMRLSLNPPTDEFSKHVHQAH